MGGATRYVKCIKFQPFIPNPQPSGVVYVDATQADYSRLAVSSTSTPTSTPPSQTTVD